MAKKTDKSNELTESLNLGEKLQKILNSIKPTLKDIGVEYSAIDDYSNKIQNNLDSIKKQQDAIKSSGSNIAKLNREISKSEKDISRMRSQGVSDSDAIFESKKKELDELKGNRAAAEQSRNRSKQDIDNATKSNNLIERSLKIFDDIGKAKKNIGRSDFKALDLSDQLKENEDAINDAINSGNDALKIDLETRREAIKAGQAAAGAQRTLNDQISTGRDKLGSFLDMFLNIIPGGKEGFLGKMLGLDGISKKIKDDIGGAMAEAAQGGGSAFSRFFKGAQAGFGALAKGITGAMGPLLGIGIVVGLAVALYKAFSKTDEALGNIQKELGVTRDEAKQTQVNAAKIASEMKVLGVDTKEVTQQIIELKKATGLNFEVLSRNNDKAKEFLETSTALTAQYGLTAQETVELNSAAAVLGKTSANIAVTAAKTGDEIMSSSELMRTISKTSKTVLFNFKGNVPALVAAVKQAKLMGTTLEKVAASGENLLDIENSLIAQNKARMMLGRNINLDAARYYALTGQTEKLLEEQKKQMGTVAEYEAMTPMNRKVLAEALGMQNEELAEIMAKQKELDILGIDEAKRSDIVKRTREGTIDAQAELNKLSTKEQKDTLMKIINDERRLSNQEKLQASMDKLMDSLTPVLTKTADIISGIVDGFSSISSAISSFLIDPFTEAEAEISETWVGKSPSKLGLGIVKGIAAIGTMLINKLISPFKDAYDYIGGLFSGIGDFFRNLFGSEKSMEKVNDAASKTATAVDKTTEAVKETKKEISPLIPIVKVIAGIIATWFVVKGAQKLIGMVGDIKNAALDTSKAFASGGKSLMEGSKTFLDNMKATEGGIGKKLLGGVKGLIKGKEEPVEETAAPKDDKVKQLTDKAEQAKSIADKLKSITETIKSFFSLIAETGKSIVDTLGTIGKAIVDNVMAIVNGIVDGLAQAAPNIRTVLKELGAGIGEFIAAIGKSVANPQAAIGIGIITLAFMGFGKALQMAAPAIKEMPPVLEELGNIIKIVFEGIGSYIESIGTAIATIINSIGDSISKVISTVADSIVKLGEVNPLQIASLGLALGTLATGLLALTAGDIISGVASFFTGGPIETLKSLEAVNGSKLKETGSGIDSMAKSLKAFGSINVDPIDNVAEALDNFNTQVIKGGIGDALNNFLGSDPFAVFDRISKIDAAKLDVVATSIEKLANSMKAFNDINADSINIVTDLLQQISDGVSEFSEIESLDVVLNFITIMSNSLAAIATTGPTAAEGLNLVEQSLAKIIDLNIQILISLSEALIKLATALTLIISISPNIAILADVIKLLANSFTQLAAATNELNDPLNVLNLQLTTLNPELQNLVSNLTNLTSLASSLNIFVDSLNTMVTTVTDLSVAATSSAPPIQTLASTIDYLSKSMAATDPYIEKFNSFVMTLKDNVDGVYAMADAIYILADAFKAMTAGITYQSGGFLGLGGKTVNAIDESAKALEKLSVVAPAVSSAFASLADTVDDAMSLILMIKQIDKINADKFDKLGNAFEKLPAVYVVDTYNQIQKQQVQSANIAQGPVMDFSNMFTSTDKKDLTDLLFKALPEETRDQFKPLMSSEKTDNTSVNTKVAPVTEPTPAQDTSNNLKNVEQLLKELIAKVDQPVIMKIGEKAVSEISNQISFRKSYAANMNTGRA